MMMTLNIGEFQTDTNVGKGTPKLIKSPLFTAVEYPQLRTCTIFNKINSRT